MLPQNTECQEAEFPLLSGSYRPSSPAVWPSLQDYYPPWYTISLACRRGQEVLNNNQLLLSLSSKLLIKCLPKIPDTRTNCVVLDIAILVLIWRNSSTLFFLVAKFHMEPQKRRLKDCFPDPWIKPYVFVICALHLWYIRVNPPQHLYNIHIAI